MVSKPGRKILSQSRQRSTLHTKHQTIVTWFLPVPVITVIQNVHRQAVTVMVTVMMQ
jgi:hypothetical protein